LCVFEKKFKCFKIFFKEKTTISQVNTRSTYMYVQM
jgi:hypothetical protein